MNPYLGNVWEKTPSWLLDEKLDATRSVIDSLRKTRLEAASKSLESNPQLTSWLALDIEAKALDFSKEAILLGKEEELSSSEKQSLTEALLSLCPWKKGPFSIFGETIDAEWRSDWKWQRIESSLGNLEAKTIADIGCNNGYFMMRALAQNPKTVIGFEPVNKNWQMFQFLNSLARQDHMYFELLGAEHMSFFPKFFDLILCLASFIITRIPLVY